MAMHKTILGRPAVEWTRIAITAAGLSEETITPDELFKQWETNMRDMSDRVEEVSGGIELLSALHARGRGQRTDSTRFDVRLRRYRAHGALEVAADAAAEWAAEREQAFE